MSLKISIRTVKGESYDLQLSDTDTIATTKVKILESHPPDNSVFSLLFAGKKLQDDQVISTLNIPDDGFLVLLEAKKKKKKKSKKKKSTAAPATTKTTTSSETSTSVEASSTPVKSATSSETPQTAAPVEAEESSTPEEASTPIPAKSEPSVTTPLPVEAEVETPAASEPNQPVPTTAPEKSQPAPSLDENDETVATLMSLGDYSRAQILQAIEISGGNVNIAAELLLSQAPLAASGPAVPPSPATGGQGVGPGGAGAEQPEGSMLPPGFPTTLEGLKNDHSFLFFRALIQQDNALLTSFLQNIAQHSPGLMAEIQSKQQEFLEMVNAPFTAAEITILKATAQQLATSNPTLHQVLTQALAGVGGVDGALGAEGAPPPGSQYITVTREENEKIQRMVDMGFDKNIVIQTFFACGKDEQATLNLLFDLADSDPTIRTDSTGAGAGA